MALNEKILENYRRSLGYDDRQWELWRSNPHNIKVAEALVEAQKYTVMAEVVKSCNCGAGHKERDRFICLPHKICIFMHKTIYGCFSINQEKIRSLCELLINPRLSLQPQYGFL